MDGDGPCELKRQLRPPDLQDSRVGVMVERVASANQRPSAGQSKLESVAGNENGES